MKALRKRQKQFILGTLLPYKKDPSTCGFDKKAGKCVYLTDDGRMCAVGKHMKKGPWQKAKMDFVMLQDDFKKEEFLTKEALSMHLEEHIWLKMQMYHDTLTKRVKGHPLFLESALTANRHIRRIEESLEIDLNELKFNV